MRTGMSRTLRRALACALIAGFAAPAWAQVTVDNVWVRGTVPSQKVTGGFLTIRSTHGGALVGADSPVSAHVEVHEMRMEGEVARMRRIERLPLPAGEPLELRPGGYHLMLMDLKQPLKAGDKVPLRLEIDAGDGKVQTIEVEAVVRGLGTDAPAHGHGHAAH